MSHSAASDRARNRHPISRELVGSAVPALSRRRFLKAMLLVAGGALLPEPRSSVGAVAGPCGDTLAQILDIAATVEALAITLYQRALATTSGLLDPLSDAKKDYLRAALDAERAHYQWLIAEGAQPRATTFYFAANSFGAFGLPAFCAAIDAIETVQIGLYLAAVRRFGESDRLNLAEIAGQILGVESEHRVLGREISLAPPDPRNDRCFEQATIACVAEALSVLGPFLTGGAGFSGPFGLPSATEISAAVAGVTCVTVPTATTGSCQESIAQILNIAATAEALGITFYYHGISAGFFEASDQRQWYLQAALDEERTHLDFLKANGGLPPAADQQFRFPSDTFTNLGSFTGVLDLLENAFIAAYLAAMQRFAQLGQQRLAEIAGQILGVESEHRVLGRIIADDQPPNRPCLERANYQCLGEAAAALAPFLQGDAGHTLQKPQPTPSQIAAAVASFACTPVQTATNPPYQVRMPMVRK
jgi:Ferritin-like domain